MLSYAKGDQLFVQLTKLDKKWGREKRTRAACAVVSSGLRHVPELSLSPSELLTLY